MGITRFPHGVSSFGVPIMGGGTQIPVTTGTYYFVDSATGSNANDGKDPDHPVATIDYAIGLCTANKGDVIVVMPNHAETISTAGGIDADVEGITIVGLGHGQNVPKVTISGSSAADIDIDADSVTFDNLEFYSAATQTNPTLNIFDINDTDFTMKNCKVWMSDTLAPPANIMITDSGVKRVKLLNNKFLSHVGATAETASVIDFVGQDGFTDAEHEIAGNVFDISVSEAHIWSTSTGMSMLDIHHNVFRTGSGATPGISIGVTTVASYGVIHHNLFSGAASDDSPKAVGMCTMFENYFTTSSAFKSGTIMPAAYAT